jgi:hypothetical protein
MFTDMDEGEIAGQLRRATSFLAPKHMPVVASLMDEDVLEMCWQGAQRWIDPYTMLAALEITKGARRTALHLERSGAHVVLARPAELDKRVLSAYEKLRSRRRVYGLSAAKPNIQAGSYSLRLQAQMRPLKTDQRRMP